MDSLTIVEVREDENQADYAEFIHHVNQAAKSLGKLYLNLPQEADTSRKLYRVRLRLTEAKALMNLLFPELSGIDAQAAENAKRLLGI